MSLSASPELALDWTTEGLVLNARDKFERLIEKFRENGAWNIHNSERGIDMCHRPIQATAESTKGRLVTQAIARHEAAMRLTRRLNLPVYETAKYSDMVSEIMSAAKVESMEQNGDMTKVTVSISPEDIRRFKDQWIG